MKKRLGICVVCCVLAWVVGLFFAADASGADGWSHGSAYYLYGYPHAYPYHGVMRLRADQPIPFHALYPPVYYSHIVPRPYGYSPYAYYPGIVTPEFELLARPYPYRPSDLGPRSHNGKPHGPPAHDQEEKAKRAAAWSASAAGPPGPVAIQNQYYSGSSVGGPMGRAMASPPLRIANPYVAEEGTASQGGSGQMVDGLQRGPQIVFPVAAAAAP